MKNKELTNKILEEKQDLTTYLIENGTNLKKIRREMGRNYLNQFISELSQRGLFINHAISAAKSKYIDLANLFEEEAKVQSNKAWGVLVNSNYSGGSISKLSENIENNKNFTTLLNYISQKSESGLTKCIQIMEN